MILVYFFGVQAFAWVSKQCVQLWNADVDVPGDKRPLLQKLALDEAYEWQKEVFTKPPTRRRNPEVVLKPKQDARSQETIKQVKKAFMQELKAMYKKQAKEVKYERRKARALSRGEPVPSEADISSEGSEDDRSEDRESLSSRDIGDEEHHPTATRGKKSAANNRAPASTSGTASLGNSLHEDDEHTTNATTAKATSRSSRGKPANGTANSKSTVEPVSPPQASSGGRWPSRHKPATATSKSNPASVNSSLIQEEEAEVAPTKAQRGRAKSSRAEEMEEDEDSMEEDEELEEEEEEEEDDDDAQLMSLPQASGADELAGLDLSSAIQRGKFILRARRAETPPPKKRKYTRRIPLSSTSPRRSSSKSGNVHDDDMGDEEEEDEKNTSKASHNHRMLSNSRNSYGTKSRRNLTSSTNALHSSSSSFVSKQTNAKDSSSSSTTTMLVDGNDHLANSLDPDELESLRLSNTIAARRILRRSGHLGSASDDTLLSLPLPTRTRNKSAPASKPDSNPPELAQSPHANNTSPEQEAKQAENDEPPSSPHSASGSPQSGATTNGTNAMMQHSANQSSSAKKSGRGKYIRKGKRDAPSSDIPEVICSACALARPSLSRQPLGLFMFYMLEDQAASQKLGLPRYACTAPHCSLKFYTDYELKSHVATHFSQVSKIYAAPPSKKPKLAEDDDQEGQEAPREQGEPMMADQGMDVDGPKLVFCNFAGCTEEDGFESVDALNGHVEKVHCGGLSSQLCSRCGSRPIFSNSIQQAPPRVGRYAGRSNASVATTCTHGKGRKLPFEPLHGLSAPSVLTLPLLNLSFQPPPMMVGSPPPPNMPGHANGTVVVTSPSSSRATPNHLPSSGASSPTKTSSFNPQASRIPLNPGTADMEDDANANNEDDASKPKRSTRLRRVSAAAAMSQAYATATAAISRDSSRERKQTGTTTSASSPGSSGASRVAPTPPSSAPPAGPQGFANPSYAASAASNSAKQKPTIIPSKTTKRALFSSPSPGVPTRVVPTAPPPAPEKPLDGAIPSSSEMGALLNLISLCSTMDE